MNASIARAGHELWPELPLEAWQDTYSTLHMWTQIVGKVRLALTPKINHWWGVPLYVNALGLTTSAIPYAGGNFEIQFDFVHHQLVIRTSNDAILRLTLAPRSVADFYREFMAALASLGIAVKIWKMPVEIPDPIPFDQDTKHASYDPEYANRFWRILVCCETIFKEFRAGFIGKASPVHFFWGSFDLAATRFSGRRAPERVEADSITREAYSHEVISAGFWPGGCTTMCGGLLRPEGRCWHFCRARMTQEQTLQSGTARNWNAALARNLARRLRIAAPIAKSGAGLA